MLSGVVCLDQRFAFKTVALCQSLIASSCIKDYLRRLLNASPSRWLLNGTECLELYKNIFFGVCTALWRLVSLASSCIQVSSSASPQGFALEIVALWRRLPRALSQILFGACSTLRNRDNCSLASFASSCIQVLSFASAQCSRLHPQYSCTLASFTSSCITNSLWRLLIASP